MSVFSDAIEDIVWKYDISYTEAVMQFGGENGVEPEALGEMVKENQTILSKIAKEASELNLIEKDATIPEDAIQLL